MRVVTRCFTDCAKETVMLAPDCSPRKFSALWQAIYLSYGNVTRMSTRKLSSSVPKQLLHLYSHPIKMNDDPLYNTTWFKLRWIAPSLHLRYLTAEDQSGTMRGRQYHLLFLLGISPFQPQFHVSSPTYITRIQGKMILKHSASLSAKK